MILYALTIFTSAFLLFLVQPIMAKQVLPWFGGSAAVWTTCMIFFQFLLLFGYTYTDFTTRKMTPRNQLILHSVLLLISLASLPILPDVSWKPAGNEDPTYRILGLRSLSACPTFCSRPPGRWCRRGSRARIPPARCTACLRYRILHRCWR